MCVHLERHNKIFLATLSGGAHAEFDLSHSLAPSSVSLGASPAFFSAPASLPSLSHTKQFPGLFPPAK